jgi:Tol biopolymer transport system component
VGTRSAGIAIVVAGILAASAPAAAFPATNGRIAFRSIRDGQSDVYTVRPDGGDLSDLTRNDAYDEVDPAWSPDGSRIAYVRRSISTGRTDLFVANVDSHGRVHFPHTNVLTRDPAWSPDGTMLAVSSQASRTAPFRIYSLNADGLDRTKLTSHQRGAADTGPTWSPDGTRIAFASDRDGGMPEIYAMRADGRHERRLTRNPELDADPAWSPDGGSIAYTTCCTNGTTDIGVMNADGTGQVDLTASADWAESDPAWSPSGTRIAFTAYPAGGGNIDVFVMDADGTARTRLTDVRRPDLGPTWEPRPTCTISGTPGPDRLRGTDGTDVICAEGGDDVVRAGGGFDLVYGGPGSDLLAGEAGNDLLFGAEGADALRGGPGYDGLDGAGGLDRCARGTDGAFVRRCED